MEYDFKGRYQIGDRVFAINKQDNTYIASFERDNVGIAFRDCLIITEFDNDTEVVGVGVYSPIGDGSSNFALWSSNKIKGSLGSGIALKIDNVPDFIGRYSVRYFVGTKESQTYTVIIVPLEGTMIYRLSWYIEDSKVLNGFGVMVGDSLAFSWGSVKSKFDFHWCLLNKNRLQIQTVRFDNMDIDVSTYDKLKNNLK